MNASSSVVAPIPCGGERHQAATADRLRAALGSGVTVRTADAEIAARINDHYFKG